MSEQPVQRVSDEELLNPHGVVVVGGEMPVHAYPSVRDLALDLLDARAQLANLGDYLREKNEIIKAYAGPTGMTPEDYATLRAERDALREVVEAARRLADGVRPVDEDTSGAHYETVSEADLDELLTALDALSTPPTTEEEPG